MSDDPIKKSVQIDLEVDTNVVNSGTNPYQKWIWMARAVDSWRIFPRLFISVYKTVLWYMDLPDPSLEQSGLISVIVGAGAAWFGLYAGTHKETAEK